MAILRSAHEVDFPPGGEVVREGSTSGGFYLVIDGEASVTVEGKELARLGPGSYFGEMSVIDGGPRSATITAVTRVNSLELTSAALRSLIRKEPSIEAFMAAELRRRLGDSASTTDTTSLDELCRQLRLTQQPDWAQQQTAPRRGLRRMLAQHPDR